MAGILSGILAVPSGRAPGGVVSCERQRIIQRIAHARQLHNTRAWSSSVDEQASWRNYQAGTFWAMGRPVLGGFEGREFLKCVAERWTLFMRYFDRGLIITHRYAFRVQTDGNSRYAGGMIKIGVGHGERLTEGIGG